MEVFIVYQPEKMSALSKKVRFLGYIVFYQGIQLQKNKSRLYIIYFSLN